MTLIGKVLADRYEILEEVGSGGMAVVYKAKCRLLNRFVAVKVLRPDLQNDAEFVRRFNVEAQAAASLTHPNIVSIFDVGNEEGLHYIVMEYIEGKTLKEYIDEKHILPWREAVGYAIQIAKGLEQAHKNSIIHRDIKPHNIIMKNDGVLKVTDFGIARANVQSTMTCEDSAIGSVHYISPEQARGGYTDERSDIYSLGVVLYEMLTGVVPFESERPVTVAIMHLQDKPVPPREHNLSIPLPLERIVLKAMAKEISLRYKNVSEMISELEDVLNDPEREPAFETEKAETSDFDKSALLDDMDATIKMPAVKQEDENKNEADKEKTVKKDNKAKKSTANADIDRKKEKKVITVAVLCAVAVILIIALAFASITGLGGLFTGSETVDIPDVEGMAYEKAIEKYVDISDDEAEYKFNIIKGDTVESELAEGTIVSQEPEAGSKVKKKDVIVITVTLSGGSANDVLMNYSYMDAREAQVRLENLGMLVKTVEEASDTVSSGKVIRQEPISGTAVEKGTEITLFVSSGPDEKADSPSENENKKDDTKPTDKGQESNKPSSNGENNENKNNATPVQKKSTMITLYGPKDKESALVQVNVNGSPVYSKVIGNGKSDVVKLEGTTSTVEVEIFHDGVSQQKSTVKLH